MAISAQPVDENGVPQKDRWIATVDVQPIRQRASQPTEMSLFWYVALPAQPSDQGHFSVLQGTADDTREDVQLECSAGDSSKFTLTAHLPSASSHPSHKWWVRPRREEQKHFSQVRWAGVNVADSWNAKHYVRNLTIGQADVQYQQMQRPGDTMDDVWSRARTTKFFGVLPNAQERKSTLMIFQHIVTLPYSLTFSLVPSDSAHTLQSSDVHQLVDERASRFQQRFDTVFPLTSEYATPSNRRFAQAALSNMLGGIGYFHGRSLIEQSSVTPAVGADGKSRKERKTETKQTAPLSLLATVPSRSFFPRGFLWDEGFHQLLVSRFDVRLSVEILRNWVGLILPSGWLPREQILGEEARRRVPSQFQVQRPTIANPPVLLLAMGRMVTRLEDRLRARAAGTKVEVAGDGSVSGQASSGGDDETLDNDVALMSEFLSSVYPKLQKHADWYFHTQSPLQIPKAERVNASTSLSSPVTFRWAGRTIDHCLASGLDDYPRAPFLPKSADAFAKRGTEQQSVLREGEGVEGHVDLHSWMVALTATMSHIASFLSRHHAGGEQRWGEVREAYRAKSLQLLDRLDELHWNEDKQMYCDYAYRHGHHHYICHVGYVSFIPFVLGLVRPSSERLPYVLSQMQSSGVWTEWGLRSLSSDDAKFATNENYWRGAVWININYLAIAALAHYTHIAQQPASLLSSVLSLFGGSSGHRQRWGDEYSHLMDHCSPLRWQDEETSGLDGRRLGAMYDGLRANVVDNIYHQYQTKGYLFENYNSTDGEGRGSHPFTGWTALVVSVLAETY